MAKSLVEMAAEIVAAQASHAKMSADEMAGALGQLVDAMRRAGALEEGAAGEPEAAAAAKPTRRRSVFRNRVICLECGREFKQLTNPHLTQHGLDKKSYKAKHGIPHSQKLVATAVSERRRQVAIDSGLVEKLAEARKKRAAKVAKTTKKG